MTDLDFKINEFKTYYNSNIELYNSALAAYTKLISPLSNVEFVNGRIKEYHECLSKFKRKYLPGIPPSNTNYNIIDYLSDFVHPEHDQKIGVIKDVAAGAVFIASIVAVIVAGIIYLPKML